MHPFSIMENKSAHFDYVIIGGGSAGCVLASRLSECEAHSVLLLEAGPAGSHPLLSIPAAYYKILGSKRYDWKFVTSPNPSTANRSLPLPRGKVLGGSSAINGMVYIRGQRDDFDEWKNHGDDGWGFEEILPYFRKSEDQERGESHYHGVGGPLGVSDIHLKNELFDEICNAANALGIPFNEDFNGSRQEGIGYYQLTARRGRRCSVNAAFLQPVLHRSNLATSTGVFVLRVLIAKGRAMGVEVLTPKGNTVIHSDREIILAAGAIGSPLILQRSGVGAEKVLRSCGILPIEILPVGENLQDHYQARIVYRCSKKCSVNTLSRSYAWWARGAVEYLGGRGAFTLAAAQLGAFLRTPGELKRPDVQLHFIPFSADAPGAPLHKEARFTVSICQLRPLSYGHVRLRSLDPSVAPDIQPNYLANEADARVLMRGIHLARRLLTHSQLAGHIPEEVTPSSDMQSDEQLSRYIRSTGGTIFHQCGTCKMGADETAVVSPDLCVRGISGLRVADASIMPSVISGNTNAAVIMIAEKAASLIRGECRDLQAGANTPPKHIVMLPC
jgi:choline dehydrogenase